MTLQEFETVIKAADPSATHYAGTGKSNYTRWREYGESSLHGGNMRQERVLRIQVDRFTKLESDPVVAAIDAALERDDIAIRDHLIDFEPDTGYIHHIWDCEVA